MTFVAAAPTAGLFPQRSPAGRDETSTVQVVIASPPAASAVTGELPLERFKRVLKGRYRWALGMTLFGMAIGGLAGWAAVKPLFASVGVAQVHPVLPRVLGSNERNDVLPMFDSYMDSRVALITSRRVIDLATNSAAWKLVAGNRTETPAFAQSIVVDHAHGSELIEISFANPSPRLALAGAQALTDAFETVFNEQDASSQQELFRVLEDRRATLASHIGATRDRIAAVSAELGPLGLQRMQDFKIEELQRMESKLHDLDMQLAMNASAASDADPIAADPHDATLAYLQQQQAQAQMQIDTLKTRTASSNPSLMAARALLEQINTRIAEHQAGPGVVNGSQRAQMQKLYDELKTDMLQNAARLVQIQKLGDELKTDEQKLDETRSRIEQLNVESMVGGRLSIVSRGELSDRPAKDKRKQLAMMLALVLGGFGFGAVLLVGMFDSRLRYVTDARAGGRALAVLGVLPRVPGDLSDPLAINAAATEVHHIRTRLQVQPAGEQSRKVFSITGANRGAGKTSLTLATGLSFAASGYRTLLIDGDLTGRGLTRRLGIVSRRRLGDILVQSGRVAAEQMDAALALAREQHTRLGEVLTAMQLISFTELELVLQLQQKESLGLADALRGFDPQHCISPMPFTNCSILPCCRVGPVDQTCVSPSAVSRLLAAVRDPYDVILIDTGPILGNAESAVLNASADAVVMMLSRGHDRGEMEQAAGVIESLHVPLLGVVFNRAASRDLRRSAGSYYSNCSTEPGGRRKDERMLLHALIGGDPVVQG